MIYEASLKFFNWEIFYLNINNSRSDDKTPERSIQNSLDYYKPQEEHINSGPDEDETPEVYIGAFPLKGSKNPSEFLKSQNRKGNLFLSKTITKEDLRESIEDFANNKYERHFNPKPKRVKNYERALDAIPKFFENFSDEQRGMLSERIGGEYKTPEQVMSHFWSVKNQPNIYKGGVESIRNQKKQRSERLEKEQLKINKLEELEKLKMNSWWSKTKDKLEELDYDLSSAYEEDGFRGCFKTIRDTLFKEKKV